jgi:hypothetical protein
LQSKKLTELAGSKVSYTSVCLSQLWELGFLRLYNKKVASWTTGTRVQIPSTDKRSFPSAYQPGQLWSPTELLPVWCLPQALTWAQTY